MEARSRFFGAPKVRLLVRALGALALVALAYMYFPPPETRTTAGRAPLDKAMPRWQFSETHELTVCAPPERIWEVLHTLPGEEILLFEPLVRLRTLNFSSAPDPRLREPLLAIAQRYGLVILTEERPYELVLGIAGRLWKLHPDLLPLSPGDPEAFAQLPVPGAAKAAFGISIDPDEGRCTQVRIETRVFAEQDALTEFAAYWRTIYPAGALLRRFGLDAVRIRAEALTKPSR